MSGHKAKAAPAAKGKATSEALEVECAGCQEAAELGNPQLYPAQTTPDGKRWRHIHEDPSDGESATVWVCSRECEKQVTGK